MSTLPVSVQNKAVFTGHRDCIYSLSNSLTENLFYSAAGDGMIVRWDINNPENGELIVSVPNSVYAIRQVPGQNHFLIGQNFEGIHLVDVDTKSQIRSLKITDSQIFDIQLFENLVFIACGDGEVIIMDVLTFRKIHTIKPSDKSARTIAINPLVREFVVGFSDHYIRVYSLVDFSLQKEWKAHSNSVFTLQFTPDFKCLVSGSRDARIKVWDCWNHYVLHQEIVAHMYAINSIDFSPDGKYFATASMDKSVKIWDAKQWQLLKVLDKSRHGGHSTSVNKLIWLSNTQLVSASDDKKAILWEITV